jgi:hypothetical protein
MVQEEGWVVCRVFKKRLATVQRMADSSPCWFDDHVAGFMPALGSPRQLMHHHHPSAEYGGHHQQLYHCKPELEYHHHLLPSQEAFLPQLSQLVESPKPPAYIGHGSSSNLQSSDEHFRYTGQQQTMKTAAYMAAVDDSATDWRVLDKFVAFQLFSHGDGTSSKEPGYSNHVPAFQLAESSKREETLDYASTSASGGGQADLWK